jgi:hypothetical protein
VMDGFEIHQVELAVRLVVAHVPFVRLLLQIDLPMIPMKITRKINIYKKTVKRIIYYKRTIIYFVCYFSIELDVFKMSNILRWSV